VFGEEYKLHYYKVITSNRRQSICFVRIYLRASLILRRALPYCHNATELGIPRTVMSPLLITEDELLERYQRLLHLPKETSNGAGSTPDVGEELDTAPLVWWSVKKYLDEKSIKKEAEGTHDTISKLPQYGVLGNVPSESETSHEPVLLNTNSPWSAFLCGSQGSGKSHTLSCMLENCLLEDGALGKNPNPLAGFVLHYDGSRGSDVCEAAYLCSSVKTTVLVSASNYGNLKQRYEEMAKQNGATIEVKKLLISPKHLDTERVKSLMAVAKDGEAPLYIQVSKQLYFLAAYTLTLSLRHW
jgi:hypothetical protein